MNKALAISFIIIVTATSGLFAIAKEEPHSGEHGSLSTQGPENFEGEILDMSCYMAHESKGVKFQAHSLTHIKRGGPIGLLAADGTVYLLVEDDESPKGYAQIKNWAAEKVSIKGELYKRGGVQAIVVKSSKRVLE